MQGNKRDTIWNALWSHNNHAIQKAGFQYANMQVRRVLRLGKAIHGCFSGDGDLGI